MYGGTHTLCQHILPKMGIECRFFDPADINSIGPLVDGKTRCVFTEAVSNPGIFLISFFFIFF